MEALNLVQVTDEELLIAGLKHLDDALMNLMEMKSREGQAIAAQLYKVLVKLEKHQDKLNQ